MIESPVPEGARHEVKFVARATLRDSLITWLRLHPGAFVEPYPPRTVNNIYFDTHNYTAYAQNLAGVSARYKLRLRWYGESLDPEHATLEVKCRRAGLGWKLSYAIASLALEGMDWREIVRELSSQLPGDARLLLDAHPLPVLMNRYRRRYFASSQEDIRVTFDWAQRVYDQRLHATPTLGRPANLPDTLVAEFKFHPRNRSVAARMIQGFPLRISRNSKYSIGVTSIRDE